MIPAGVTIPDPWGKDRLVFPQLFSYVVDDPEGKDVSCIKGVPSAEPCEFCRARFGQLLQIRDRWPSRSEAHQKQLYERAMRCTTATEREALCKKYSFHPVASGLWGFAFADDPGLGGSAQCFAFESMHNEDLGVFLYIIENIPVSVLCCPDGFPHGFRHQI
jgi:hypothetical protein